MVKKSGYFMRKLALLCMDTLLSTEENDCKSTNYVKVKVFNDGILDRLNGRWYNKKGKLTLIDRDNKELIGKELEIRSPITCRSQDGKICKRCYGKLHYLYTNGFHIGISAILILSSQLTQSLLSAKHLLTTKSEEIDWGALFKKYFIIDTNSILINSEFIDKDISLIINLEDIIDNEDEVENNDEDEQNRIDDIEKKSIKTFKIEYKKNNQVTTQVIESPKNFYFGEILQEIIDNNKEDEKVIKVPFKTFNLTDPLFYFVIENNELAKYLHDILNLIDHKGHLNITNYHDITNKFCELLNESKIVIDLVHVENIIRELIREKENSSKRPDFSKPESEIDYEILRVTDAILKSPSIAVSLSFEQIKKQIYDPDTYEKDGKSLLDELI